MAKEKNNQTIDDEELQDWLRGEKSKVPKKPKKPSSSDGIALSIPREKKVLDLVSK